jgi:hypothetical protein
MGLMQIPQIVFTAFQYVAVVVAKQIRIERI